MSERPSQIDRLVSINRERGRVSELSEGAIRNISRMQRMAKTLPDDFFMVEAVQELAETVARIERKLSVDDAAILLGIGALMIREGRQEALAGIHAALVIHRAKTGRTTDPDTPHEGRN